MIADIQRRTVYRYQTAVLANAVSQRLRAMDVLVKADEGRLLILCPELSAEETAWLCKQLEKTIATDMGLDVRCAASLFPGEGLTFDGLQDTAVGKLGQTIDIRHQTKDLKKSSSPVIS
ncbi:MAG: hypothetical protein KDD89_15090 [Anaerolineales bacterium]|nr:hypothetical protein [Anaerolineales bacterium]